MNALDVGDSMVLQLGNHIINNLIIFSIKKIHQTQHYNILNFYQKKKPKIVFALIGTNTTTTLTKNNQNTRTKKKRTTKTRKIVRLKTGNPNNNQSPIICVITLISLNLYSLTWSVDPQSPKQKLKNIQKKFLQFPTTI